MLQTSWLKAPFRRRALPNLSVHPLALIILVMLAAGAVGGVVNYFISDNKDEKPLDCWQHVVVGIAASFVVPLLLNMTSSDLIDKIRGAEGKQPDPGQLLVLAGFCLLAAASSRAFIRSLSQRILEQAEAANRKATEALEKADDATSVVAPLVEGDAGGAASPSALTPPAPAGDDADEATHVLDHERQLLVALKPFQSGYTMRTVAGLSGELKRTKQEIQSSLESLMDRGLVSMQRNLANRKVLWSLTPEGRRIADSPTGEH